MSMQAMLRPPHGPQVQVLDRCLLPRIQRDPSALPHTHRPLLGQAVLATSPGSKDLSPYPLLPLPRERWESQNPGHTAAQKTETSETCKRKSREKSGRERECVVFMRREFCMPVSWAHGHTPHTSTRLAFPEDQADHRPGLTLRGP